MSKCNKCGTDSYEVRDMKLMGGYKAKLCPLCITVFDDTHLGVLKDNIILVARVDAAIAGGNASHAGEIAGKIADEQNRLYWISKKWVCDHKPAKKTKGKQDND